MTTKIRILVICSSWSEGVFFCLKKKEDGTYSLTYSEELQGAVGRKEARAWVTEKLETVFGRRTASRLMDSRDTFFEVESGESQDQKAFNFVVVVEHGQVPNTISDCVKKKMLLVDVVAEQARVEKRQPRNDALICMSAPVHDVVLRMIEKYPPKKKEEKVPATV